MKRKLIMILSIIALILFSISSVMSCQTEYDYNYNYIKEFQIKTFEYNNIKFSREQFNDNTRTINRIKEYEIKWRDQK